MFTGIVQMVGRISAVETRGDGRRLAVDTGVQSSGDVAIGDSVAVSGCCLTVVAIEGATMYFDVSAETLRCTTGLDRLGDVNLELALRLSDRLGGHLMSGHVDGVGVVRGMAPVSSQTEGSYRLEIEAPRELARFIAPKGSIAVDGVSLTVNALPAPCVVQLALIEYTLRHTTLGALEPGGRVQLEADLLAKHVQRLLAPFAAGEVS